MSSPLTMVHPRWLKRASALLGLFAFAAGAAALGGWVFNIPRLTDWFNDGISMQPNTAILIASAGAAVFFLKYGCTKLTWGLSGFVAIGGLLNLLQYVSNIDLGFNHQLLFGRTWGSGATMTPGRFGPPASISFLLIGTALILLRSNKDVLLRYVPGIALIVVLFMTFSLLGYLFDARNFYAIPGFSAISLPTATVLMALALALIINVPQHQPMVLLCERSSAGTMARTVLPILLTMIPLLVWLRVKGYNLGLFDVGTSRALGAAMQMLGVVALMWMALMALRRREHREREADRRKDEFLAMLAHELRNPLAPISNATAMLKFAGGNQNVVERTANMIERQTTHLVRLIDDLLDLSRISRGKLDLRRERIALAPVIRQAVELVSPLADAAQQEIIIRWLPQPIYLDADPVRLSQVISNLLNNACKFSGVGERIYLSVDRTENDLVISVKDNGMGMPADMLDGIFEMFVQIDQSLERTHGGLGIGLTLAKRLMELHGGIITAQSDGIGSGSEFIVRLPITLDQTPLPMEKESANRPAARNRVLIVDDNVDSAKSLAELLSLIGNETFVVHDGESAVIEAERLRPEVILLDLGLPKINGFDACRRIREYPWAENILIIAITGWGQQEDRRKSAEAGFDIHMVKPVDLAELTNLLAQEHDGRG
jgi:signal transduction histidine kinase/CheY-like chemotaxis protein